MIIKKKEHLYLGILGILAMTICFCSPLHPFAKAFPSVDSSAFLLIGKSMSQGMMPYTDLFDHKGPLLYLINWIGMMINYQGVWVIELVCMILSIYLCYRCARRFFNDIASFFGTLATFIALFQWFDGGNLTEEYALPLMFGALYCLTGYFVQEFKLNRMQVFVSGVCMGGVLMLRVNMIGLWLGMCAIISLHTLYIHKLHLIFRYLLFFLAGVTVSVLPFIIWLGIKGALADFYFCYIYANFLHIDNNSLIDRLKAIIFQLNFPIVIIAATVLLVLIFFKKRDLKNSSYILVISLSISFGASIFTAALSGYTYSHYYMILLPNLVLPITYLIEKAIIHLKIKSYLIMIVIVLILNYSVCYGLSRIRSTMIEDSELNYLATVVKENNAQNSPILSIGNSRIYLKTDCLPATYFPYFARGTSHPLMIERYISEISRNKPEIIVQETSLVLDELMNYLNKNYSMIYETDNVVVYKRL